MSVISRWVPGKEITRPLLAGYGHIAPITPVGKLVTIFYAIIGIPLFLLYLSNIGDIMAKSFKWTYSRLCKCQRGQKPPEQIPSGILKKPDTYRIQYIPQHVHGLNTQTTSSQQPAMVCVSALLLLQICKRDSQWHSPILIELYHCDV